MPVLYLSLSATKIPKLDRFSASDPFVVAKIDGRVCGRTEVVMNDPNPTWTTRIGIPFRYGAGVPVTFEVFNFTKGDVCDESKHDFVGKAQITPEHIMAGEGHVDIMLDSPHGSDSVLSLVPIARPPDRVAGAVDMTISNIQTGGSGKYTVKLVRLFGTEDVVVTRSSPFKRGATVEFKAIPMDDLCQGGENRAFRIVLAKTNNSDGESRIGQDFMTIGVLEQIGEAGLDISFSRDYTGKGPAPTAHVCAKITYEPLFTDFAPRCNVLVATAVDLSRPCEGAMMEVIRKCFHTAAAIDTDGRIPVFGFGATHGNGKCFPLVDLVPTSGAGKGGPCLSDCEYPDVDTAVNAIDCIRQVTDSLASPPMLSLVLQRAIMASVSLDAVKDHLFFFVHLLGTPCDSQTIAQSMDQLPDYVTVVLVYGPDCDVTGIADHAGLVKVPALSLFESPADVVADELLSDATARAAKTWAAAGVAPISMN